MHMQMCSTSSRDAPVTHRSRSGAAPSCCRQEELQVMSVQSTPLSEPCLTANGGIDARSVKKMRMQSADERQHSLRDGHQQDDINDKAAQQSCSAQGQEDAGVEAGPQLSTDHESMTDTVSTGVYMMQTRKKAIDTKVQMTLVSAHQIQTTSLQVTAFFAPLEGSKLNLWLHLESCHDHVHAFLTTIMHA